MHYLLVNIFILLLALSSSSKVPSSLLVEARHQQSSNGTFTLHLIHRDSPLSPYYNSSITPLERLKRAPLGSISHGHNIHRYPSSYLIPNGGDYLIKIALGTPKVELTAVADTGSDLIWVQCSPCDECLPSKSPPFIPKKSSTYHPIPCTSPSCKYPHIIQGCLPNYTNKSSSSSAPCYYEALYGDGTQSVGILATETISLPSSNNTTSPSHPSIKFGCGFDQRGQVGIQGEGIVGLGTGSLSLVSQLGPYINYKFSYCLAPLSSGVPSKLTFGAAHVTSPKVVTTPLVTGLQSTFYYLTLYDISIGNNASVPVNQDIIIDSGTTLTYLPQTIYDNVKTALSTAIKLTPVPDPLQFYDLCYDARRLGSSGGLNTPDVVFHFKGADVVLKGINTFRTLEDQGLICLAMSTTEGTPILGNIAQVNFEVGFDLHSKKVSFAPTDCTKH
ncbi:aspartic proteinase CDR1-like [Chenopodium quinoa]|uniref:aspartic proteinase CDR1-like n=1 Tax=Chenopodium quinoa TaxID=63459 RepID=UPI000B7921CF|nr:aspartic proteinase CDR1-like [Chenopodium quinoa]